MTAENEGPLGKAPDISVGVSDTVLLLVSGAGFVFLAVTIYSIVLAKLKSSEEIEEEGKEFNYDEKLANADVSTLNRAQRRARARHIMKQQRRITPAGGVLGENGDIDDNNQVQENEASHLSRKDRQKAAKSAEKEERRLYENERRQQQQEAQKLAQQEKKERERLMTEKTDEERQARYEQRITEELTDYENWRTFLASPDGSNVLTVKEWIAELQKSRLVYVKKLAERFDISRETVEERIQHILAASRVTGIQDGNRFIYLSMQEMTDVASFLQARDKTSLEQILEKIEEIIGD
jgi:hypothetical protein